jgi:hypothetical protein
MNKFVKEISLKKYCIGFFVLRGKGKGYLRYDSHSFWINLDPILGDNMPPNFPFDDDKNTFLGTQ